MPHSSGGGSHGGGFHGGSFHGGGSSGSRSGFSRTYYPGAIRYVYYDARHNPQIIYSAEKPSDYKPTSKGVYIFLLIMLAVSVTVLGLLFLRIPQKLSMDYDTAIVIKDRADILSAAEKESIRGVFAAFREKTGITPALFTTTNEAWQERYPRLERYAYDLYVNAFPDEKH